MGKKRYMFTGAKPSLHGSLASIKRYFSLGFAKTWYILLIKNQKLLFECLNIKNRRTPETILPRKHVVGKLLGSSLERSI